MDKWVELKIWLRNSKLLETIHILDVLDKMEELENPKILVDRQVIINAIEYVNLLRNSLLTEYRFDSAPLIELEELLK